MFYHFFSNKYKKNQYISPQKILYFFQTLFSGIFCITKIKAAIKPFQIQDGGCKLANLKFKKSSTTLNFRKSKILSPDLNPPDQKIFIK